MFICRACLRRSGASLAVTHSAHRSFALNFLHDHQLSRRTARCFATAHDVNVNHEGTEPKEVATPDWKEKQARKLEWTVRNHLNHAQDPFKIAQIVENVLAKGRYDEALALTKEASVDRQCVVSWNHLIDYQMQNQRLHAAIKLFNDVCLEFFPSVQLPSITHP